MTDLPDRLIAIMLGRLEMDVDECIEAYNELSAGVFAEPRRRIPVDFSGRLAPRFDLEPSCRMLFS